MGPVPVPRQPRCAAPPISEGTSDPELETGLVDPEFVLLEEVRYPTANRAATLDKKEMSR